MNRLVAVLFLSLSLTACGGMQPRTPSTIDDYQSAQKTTEEKPVKQQVSPPPPPPPSVTKSLLPKAQVVKPAYQESRFDISVENAPAKAFFMGLVEGTPINMVVHPSVNGEISLSLKKVTVEEVLQVVRDIYGFEFKLNAAGYYILPAQEQTRVFHVNYVNLEREGSSDMQVSSGQVGESASNNNDTSNNNDKTASKRSGSRVKTQTRSAFWSELQISLQAIVADDQAAQLMVSPQSGIVLVRAMPDTLRQVELYLSAIQASVQRQVILEAKILEVVLSDGYQAGINWSQLFEFSGNQFAVGSQVGGGSLLNGSPSPISGNSGDLNPQSTTFPNGSSVQGFGGAFTLALGLDNFSAFVELLSTQGNVQVLSSPRVVTVNNQKAVIKVGQDEFFVTEISSDVTTSGSSTTQSPEIEFTPFFSGIALDVTPQISPQGEVILHVHPTVSEVVDQQKSLFFNGSEQIFPLALSSIRETDSIVRAKSGQIIVIGGLMKSTTTEAEAGTPVLSDIPYVGSLFRHVNQVQKKSELVILLKPIVVDDNSWSDAINQSNERIDGLKRGFKMGGKYKQLGTMGEVE